MGEIKKSGYDTAIKLTDQIARTIWSVYTALLATNAFLLSFAAFVAPILSGGSALARLVGLLGALICIAWFLITMRNFDYFKYYFAWARKYEEEAFGDDVTMIRSGESFARGNEVNDLGASIRFRWGSRLFRVEWLVYVVIISFLSIYGYLIVIGQ